MKQDTKAPLLSMEQSNTQLSLPKGGGAIRGIDERFSVNAANGTAGLRVPIFVSPGRGSAPELALSYNSGAGNGPFGFGWSLEMPSVTRSTNKRLPTYKDQGDDADTYTLAGAEELVPTLIDQGGGTWLPDVLTRTEQGNAYEVQRYRPRIEGSFIRIERWKELATGQIHWRTISPENVTAIFGQTQQAQISDPQDSSRVFEWLLEEQFDDKGHVTQYQYAAEDLVGVAKGDLFEAHRLASGSQAQRYLKRIFYGNKSPFLRQDWLFELLFDYGEHPDVSGGAVHSASQPWPVRQDAFSDYRAGFERRTYRLCRRVLMFHHIDALRTAPTLVRSTDFVYDEDPIATRLTEAGQTGYVWQEGTGSYLSKSLPKMQFAFSEAVIDASIQEVPQELLRDLPAGAIASAQWVDLEAEGLPGMLVEHEGGLYYKHNLGEGRFGALHCLDTQPNLRPGQGRLMDLAGDGRLEMVKLETGGSGAFARTEEGWRQFHPFSHQPQLRWDDPNMRFVDLDGDGRADLLITEDQVLRWYPSLGEEGFAQARQVSMALDDASGPRLVFNEPLQSVFLADMSGDGLTDLVRIRNGKVAYWPNLGHGHFGARVEMADGPHFDLPEQYDPRFLRLADIDGSGTTDLLYLRPGAVSVWWNQSGNRWSSEQVLEVAFPFDQVSSVTVMDLLGQGTACLVWSSSLPGHTQRSLRFIDLMGGQKPYLMTTIQDNMGAETHLTYASSTKFYVQDKLAGRPWVTKLPFPVQVIEEAESIDHIAETKTHSQYAYHHGFYDGHEREFRGFGCVEQWDTERYPKDAGIGQFTETPALEGDDFRLPPVRTVSWYHTGAYFAKETLEQHYKSEYYTGDSLAQQLPDTLLPVSVSAQEAQEATRALKGSMLRQEIYAEDGSSKASHPYAVTESCAQVEKLQPGLEGTYGVFLVHPAESISFHYERDPNDPRVTHELTLAVDSFGQVTRSAQVAYPRRQVDPAMPEQGQLLVTTREDTLIHETQYPEWYRLSVPQESCTYEVTGLVAADISVAALKQKIDNATLLSYEEAPTGGQVEKRLLSRTRALYAKNDQSGPLAAGQIESLGLPYETYEQIYSPGLLQNVYGTKVDSTMLTDAGYQLFDGVWWAPSGRTSFDASGFYLPTTQIDPLGRSISISYDSDSLLPVQTTDPLGNVSTVQNDYRLLQPWEMTDPNGNRTQAAFDALGMTVGTAVMGKSSESVGDSLAGFVADLTQAQIDAYLADPINEAQALLGQATTRFVYDVTRYSLTGQPNVTCQISRETHVSELGQGASSALQLGFVYADGSGRELMKKIQAEPGLAPKRDGSGGLVFDGQGALLFEQTSARWVGTGAKIYDNKGNPYKEYEPFFSSTHMYETEDELRHWGVTSLLIYDAMDRVVRTELPDGTFSKVDFDAWKQITYDASDTVLDSAWYTSRNAPSASGSEPTDPDERAAWLSAQHANTPATGHLDVLGRTFLTQEDDGSGTLVETRSAFDIEGNLLSVTDARGNTVMAYQYDMRGPNGEEQEAIEKGEGGQESHQIQTESMDAGERWSFRDVLDSPRDLWDARGYHFQTTYDDLQRPTHQYATDTGSNTKLLEYTVYGESLGASASTTNHRGQVFQQYDGAGLSATVSFDFKGNLLEGKRQFATEYKQSPDWTSLGSLTDPAQLATASASLLEVESFTTKMSHDALGRVITQETPDASVTRYQYNEASLLNSVDVQVRGEVDGSSNPVWTSLISNIDYDAKGQRQTCTRGNGVETTYTYDPQSYRLTRLQSQRSNGDVLQDLKYTYDASGNITEQSNDAQQTLFYNNEQIEPTWKYVYDSLYRLTEVKGREHAGQLPTQQNDATQMSLQSVASPEDPQAMRNYTRQYSFDKVGNLSQMKHICQGGGWTRRYEYAGMSNRLQSTSVPGDDPMLPLPIRYQHDAHGNMTQMPHLPGMTWDESDQLQSTYKQVVGSGTPETTYYTYDAQGQRVRKVTENQASAGQTPTKKKERLYLGSWERYCTYNSGTGTTELERESLSVMDDQQRIALVETKTIDAGSAVSSPSPVVRVQLEDHLGSCVLEVTGDSAASVITYEEHHPFGTSSYRAKNSGIQASENRYRYTGKERDEENGFTYHGARYYAPWLGRWTAADPGGMVDGPNLYAYVGNQPIIKNDPTGRKGKKEPFMGPPEPFMGPPEPKSLKKNKKSKAASGPIIKLPKNQNIFLGYPYVQMGGGILAGTSMALLPLGPLLIPAISYVGGPKHARMSRSFQVGVGAGETATGLAMLYHALATAMSIGGGGASTGGAITMGAVSISPLGLALVAGGTIALGFGMYHMSSSSDSSADGSSGSHSAPSNKSAGKNGSDLEYIPGDGEKIILTPEHLNATKETLPLLQGWIERQGDTVHLVVWGIFGAKKRQGIAKEALDMLSEIEKLAKDAGAAKIVVEARSVTSKLSDIRKWLIKSGFVQRGDNFFLHVDL